MQTIALAPDVNGTRLGFGCAGLMRDSSRKRRQRLLAAAFEEGIRHFDVARMYGLGAAEGELGEFARGRRESILIATKFGIEPASSPGRLAALQGPARTVLARVPALRDLARRHAGALHRPHRYDAAMARASLEQSLRALRTDYVDILFLHDPAPHETGELEETYAYLEEARRAGHLRAWGVAGESDPCVALKRALPAPAVLQVRDDIFRRAAPGDELKPLVTFGVLSGALTRVTAYLESSPQTCARWSAAAGFDCRSSEAIASALLRDALRANPEGTVLLSTVREEHLRGVGDLPAATGEDITTFRTLVAHERVPELHRG
jgi:hypothetical protein